MPDFRPVMKDYKKLTPFKFQILQSFPFIAEDFDSLTNYELLCKVVEYLNDVIKNENNVEDNVTALYNSFVELQNYVNHYFDSLDIQDEVNIKLDEMVEDGTFDRYIERILMMNFVYTYDNKYLLQNASIPTGAVARINGDEFFNDGIIDYYKINGEPNQLFNINGVNKINAYYSGAGEQIPQANNTSFLGIVLPQGKITISTNNLIAKVLGFTSNDFSIGHVFNTRIEAGQSLTIDNDGTYQYFGFYCGNASLENLQVMFNKGETALPYEEYYQPKSTDITLNSGQIASLINDFKLNNSYIVEDINITEHICEDENTYTKYWVTHIPRYDNNGNINELKLGFANDENYNFLTPQTAKDFSDMKNATLVINAGVSWTEYQGHQYAGANMHGLRVLNHVEISNNYEDEWYKKSHYALGITDDGTLLSFGTVNPNTGDVYQSFQESQQLDCKYVTSAFTPIMINGISQKNIIPNTNQWVNNGELVYYQRQVIGQNTTTKDIYIITSNGKGTRLVDGSETKVIDKGLTLDYCISVLQSLGCDFAYQLDEGGSTSTIYRGKMINTPTDSSGRVYRKVSDFLYVDKRILTDKDKDIAFLNKEIGKLKYEISRLHNKLFLNVDSDYTFEIQRWQNNVLTNTLNLRSYGLEYYDNINHKKLLSNDSLGLIETQYGKHGKFSASAKRRSDDTSFSPFSDVFIYYRTETDAPYQNVNALCMSFVLWDDNSTNQMIQFALPHAGDPVTGGLKPRYRTKTYNSTLEEYTWSNWIDIG